LTPLRRKRISDDEQQQLTTRASPQLVAPVTTNEPKKPTQDYWKIQDGLAIRVHVRSRLYKFTPGMKNTAPGTNRDTDPLLHRLGDGRITRAYFKSEPTKRITIDDSWMHVMSNDPLAEPWTGETVFNYLPPAPRPFNVMM
jgi:hypothetical protein